MRRLHIFGNSLKSVRRLYYSHRMHSIKSNQTKLDYKQPLEGWSSTAHFYQQMYGFARNKAEII
jgi:hypothetical protein